MVATTTARAAIYCRVSGKPQEDGYSLDDQERACRAYAADYGLDVALVIHETGDSEDVRRPKLQALLAAGRRREIDTLICWKQDRLARGATIHVALYFCDEAGIAPHCVTEPFSQGIIDTSVRAIVSGEERKNIRLRTQAGRQARARSGKLIPGPRPLYGYRYKDDGVGRGQTKVAYEPDPETAPVVRRIFRELASGLSLRKVANGLHGDGVPTPWRAKRWISSSVRLISLHPAYCGEAGAYGSQKRERVRGAGGRLGYQRVARPEGERIALPEGTIPPLITAEEWRQAREYAAVNKREAVRRNRDPEAFLLRAGYVRCGHCGLAAHTVWKPGKKGTNQTACPNYTIFRRPSEGSHIDCPGTIISAERLDAAVWARVEEVLTNPAVVEEQLARLREDDPTRDDLAWIIHGVAAQEPLGVRFGCLTTESHPRRLPCPSILPHPRCPSPPRPCRSPRPLTAGD